MKLFPNRRHRKILFLISLPQTTEFQSCAEQTQKCIATLKAQKVDVFETINRDTLSKANRYEIVFVVAHKDEESDNLVLSNGLLSIDEFVSYFPPDFDGLIDFASCYSASVMKHIKERCPKCLVHAYKRQVTLTLQLKMYPHIVNLLNENKNKKYNEAYSEVLGAVEKRVLKPDSDASEDDGGKGPAVKLGKKSSSVYAPSAVKKNNPFLIQVFFHNDENGKAVAIEEAKHVDPKTKHKETIRIPLRIKMKDRISVRLSIVSPERNFIEIENDADTKSVEWNGQQTKVTFCATVGDSFSLESFVCKLMMEVNCTPIGECMFPIKVADKVAPYPTEVSLKPYDINAEKQCARKSLSEELLSNLQDLKEKLKNAKNDSERESLNHDIECCQSCISLLDEGTITNYNPVKKVFVSSTSDLKEYRDIVKDGIEYCNMYAEMYEKWPQTNLTPKNECCLRVLSSDILFCILGSRYGYVEQTLGMSMTEIEYRAALSAGKDILVCIINPRNDSDESDELKARQERLIEDVQNKRILNIFTDKTSLYNIAIANLSPLRREKD